MSDLLEQLRGEGEAKANAGRKDVHDWQAWLLRAVRVVIEEAAAGNARLRALAMEMPTRGGPIFPANQKPGGLK